MSRLDSMTAIMIVWALTSGGANQAGPDCRRLRRMLLLSLLALAVDAAAPKVDLVARYRPAASRIIAAAMADDGAWRKLAYLCDRIGARPSGSAAQKQAAAWAKAAMAADGHENVRTEDVKVPHWERGAEQAMLLSPAVHRLELIGLGGTVATPKDGITADVLVAPTFEALEAMGDRVKGKIVLFSYRLEPVETGKVPAYGTGIAYRGAGPSRAAKQGAVAVLIRSLATHSLRTPHTGALKYEPQVPAIPAAALSTEDADMLVRLAEAGDRVTVRLKLASRTLPDATDSNVLAELRGRERPDEIVLVGAHLDSWDVGQGAHDDGAGVAMAMQALTLLRKLGLTPRRTIRVVLFTNEETAGRGAQGYAERHRDELARHVAALETDSGGGRPVGLSLPPGKPGLELLRQITALTAPVGATTVGDAGHPGADLRPLEGVPQVAYEVEASRYWDYHHSQADTLDKVDPTELRRNVAALAVTAYVLADMPGRLDGK
jgi:carboxypeptidase Q